MNYKKLFRKIISLLSSPAKAWEEIVSDEDKRDVLGAFVYPMIALCGMSVFIGSLFDSGLTALGFQSAMTGCCSVFVALFGGYFLVAYLVNKIGNRIFQVTNDIFLVRRFVGYSMVVTFVLDIINGIVPGFFILRWIFQFYVLFIVWEGAHILLRIDEQRRMAYTIMVSLLIILCPAILGFVFDKLSVILN